MTATGARRALWRAAPDPVRRGVRRVSSLVGNVGRRRAESLTEQWFDARRDRYTPFDLAALDGAAAQHGDAQRVEARRRCNICRWEGERFDGPAHCEAATCPRCGAIGRDRFLFWSMQHCVTPPTGRTARLLETSPRLGRAYRFAMAQWFDYLCSDFDERAHAGMIRVDLQAIDLPADSIDVILSPHVLEHVPDTDRALSELYRVLRPGGRLLLQVPLLQGRTAPPDAPEFHGDDTPVFWRFGPDLGDRLAAAGFTVRLLAPAALVTAAREPASGAPARPWPQPVSPEFDVEDLLAALRDRPELEPVATPQQTERYGFEPVYMYLTWSLEK